MNDTWAFDGTSWTQLDVGGPPARVNAGMATVGDRIVLFGGSADDLGSDPLDDTWTFDGTSWTEITVANHPSARATPTIASMP